MKMLAIANYRIEPAANQTMEERTKGYRSVRETSKKWGVSIRWVNQPILAGRALGCERPGLLLDRSGGCDEVGKTKAARKKQERKDFAIIFF